MTQQLWLTGQCRGYAGRHPAPSADVESPPNLFCVQGTMTQEGGQVKGKLHWFFKVLALMWGQHFLSEPFAAPFLSLPFVTTLAGGWALGHCFGVHGEARTRDSKTVLYTYTLKHAPTDIHCPKLEVSELHVRHYFMNILFKLCFLLQNDFCFLPALIWKISLLPLTFVSQYHLINSSRSW